MPDHLEKVVITGASSGIGSALAQCYAVRGATLGLIARRTAALHDLSKELSIKTNIYGCDVRDATALRAAAENFIQQHGCPDIVIANAGVSVGTLTEHAQDNDVFQSIMGINVVGAVHTFQPFIEPMRKAGRGKLVGIASVAGYRGLPGAGAYSASKAALISYLESLRVELRPAGISVITICPGYITTPMTAHNPYAMPFIMDADRAAQKMISIIDRGKNYAVIPWQMAVAARVLRVTPNWLYDYFARRAPHKPRGF